MLVKRHGAWSRATYLDSKHMASRVIQSFKPFTESDKCHWNLKYVHWLDPSKFSCLNIYPTTLWYFYCIISEVILPSRHFISRAINWWVPSLCKWQILITFTSTLFKEVQIWFSELWCAKFHSIPLQKDYWNSSLTVSSSDQFCMEALW